MNTANSAMFTRNQTLLTILSAVENLTQFRCLQKKTNCDTLALDFEPPRSSTTANEPVKTQEKKHGVFLIFQTLALYHTVPSETSMLAHAFERQS